MNKATYTNEDVNLDLVSDHVAEICQKVMRTILNYTAELEGSDKFNAHIAEAVITDRLDTDTINDIIADYYAANSAEVIEGANWGI